MSPFWKNLQFYLKAFWLYGPGVATVILSYHMLTNLSQGQDIVMIAGENMKPFAFSLICVTLWSFLIWYSSRLIGYEKKFASPHWPVIVLSSFPRLLAYNAFISVQAAIFALPTMYDLVFWQLLLLIIFHNAYYFLILHVFKSSSGARVETIAAIIVALAYPTLIFILPVKEETDHDERLAYMSVLLFMLQIAAMRFFTWRRTRIDDEGKKKNFPAIDYVTLFGRKLIRVPGWFKESEQLTFIIFNMVAIIVIIVDVIALSSFEFAAGMGPLAAALFAFGLLAGAANFLSYLSLRFGFNAFFILLILAWAMGSFSRDPYEVKLSQSATPHELVKRDSLTGYFAKWVDHRRELIERRDTFHVYLVLADGGASRSGYWVASVLSKWREQWTKTFPGDSLENHLLCLSGASGGSVGNATFYAAMRSNQMSDLDASRNFLKNDFLSSCILYYLGPDLARHIVPVPFVRDRAEAISDAMAFRSKLPLEDLFSKNVSEVLDASGKLPILFINTTSVQDGMPAVVSSVSLRGFSRRHDVLDKIDSVNIGKRNNISFSSAVMLSARFPYVSPAGKIGDYYFVDGGYFDNSGAGIVHEMMQAVQKYMRIDTARALLYQKLRFTAVHITNTPPTTAPNPLHPLMNDLAAPLVTVFNTYGAQTDVNDDRLETFILELGGDSTRTYNLYTASDSSRYPMNWVISQYHLNKMNQRLDKIQETLIVK